MFAKASKILRLGAILLVGAALGACDVSADETALSFDAKVAEANKNGVQQVDAKGESPAIIITATPPNNGVTPIIVEGNDAVSAANHWLAPNCGVADIRPYQITTTEETMAGDDSRFLGHELRCSFSIEHPVTAQSGKSGQGRVAPTYDSTQGFPHTPAIDLNLPSAYFEGNGPKGFTINPINFGDEWAHVSLFLRGELGNNGYAVCRAMLAGGIFGLSSNLIEGAALVSRHSENNLMSVKVPLLTQLDWQVSPADYLEELRPIGEPYELYYPVGMIIVPPGVPVFFYAGLNGQFGWGVSRVTEQELVGIKASFGITSEAWVDGGVQFFLGTIWKIALGVGFNPLAEATAGATILAGSNSVTFTGDAQYELLHGEIFLILSMLNPVDGSWSHAKMTLTDLDGFSGQESWPVAEYDYGKN